MDYEDKATTAGPRAAGTAPPTASAFTKESGVCLHLAWLAVGRDEQTSERASEQTSSAGKLEPTS